MAKPTAKRWTDVKDDRSDKRAGIREGSVRDKALDRRRGVPENDARKVKAARKR